MPQDREALLQKLAPETIRGGLVRAGIFLAGWELLKAQIQDSVRGFYLVGCDADGLRYSEDYTSRVLAKHPSVFEASLLWLVDQGALDATQATQVRPLRDKRNEVAHELPKLLIDPAHEVPLQALQQMRELLAGLGRFWGRIEVDISPDFDDTEVADADIMSGSMLLMEHLLAVASELASRT
jgi:hypothetical protein